MLWTFTPAGKALLMTIEQQKEIGGAEIHITDSDTNICIPVSTGF